MKDYSAPVADSAKKCKSSGSRRMSSLSGMAPSALRPESVVFMSSLIIAYNVLWRSFDRRSSVDMRVRGCRFKIAEQELGLA